MKKFFSLIIVALFIICGSFSFLGCEKKNEHLNVSKNFTVEDTLSNGLNQEAKVVLLYGQSNATGCSSCDALKEKNSTLYNTLNAGYSNIYINYITENGANSSNNKFQRCKLGCGASSNYFGPEASIAKTLKEKYNNQKIFIIKYTYGGTNLNDQWLDGNFNRGELYDAALSFTKTSLDYLLTKNYKLDILGICWMQGESDANSFKNRYYDNTNNFVNFLRTDLKDFQSSIPFIDSGISEVWNNYKTINKAKIDFSNKSNINVYIPTISLGLTTNLEPSENPDIAHYDSDSMVKLGEAFAEEMIYLNQL